MKTFKKSFIKKKLLGKASAKETFRESFIKAQSAMEYLMTYGWAILIVAVVLGALYSLGVFNGAAFLGTSCIAASGFYCTNPTLSTGGVLTVTIGQATGTTFKNAFLYFVPSGTNFSTSDPGTSIGTLNSGQQVTASIPLGVGSPYPAAYTLGTPLSGYLYLQFTDIYGTTEVNKIATVLTKVTASSSGATFSQPTSIPSGIVAYVPITLTNSQSSATPSPFQQMIQINEGNYANYIAYNGNIANFEFYTQSGQILPAWIESNSSGKLITWVKLTPSIAASGKLTIYLGFASKTTNLLSSSGTTGIGEAPQLSSTYAQYDNGASVFTNYWNFAGTSCPSGWTCSGATINNGISIPEPSYAETSTNYGLNANQIADAYGNMPTPTTYYNAGFAYTNPTSVSSASSGNGGAMWVTNNYKSSSSAWVLTWTGSLNGNASINNIYNSSVTVIGYHVWTIYWGSTSSVTFYYDYKFYSSSTTDIPSVNLPIGFFNNQNSQATIGPFYWVRLRAYPPKGVMPSVSFGGLSSA